MGFSSRVGQHIRSNVVGYVAVFLALTGTAAALPGTNSVDSGDIINGQVKTGDLGDGQVKTADLGIASVRTARLAPNAVTSDRVADGTLTGTDIADGSLGGADVADGSLGGADIADGSITEGDVADGSLTDSDIANNSLTGADIRDNFVTGADIDESTLGQVPSATLGGLGRSASQNAPCDPENAVGFSTCAGVSINLPSQTRVALVSRVTGNAEPGADSGHGVCRLTTSTTGAISSSQVHVHALDVAASGLGFSVGGATSLAAVTPTVGPGTVTFGIECNQQPTGAIVYSEADIVAVALSNG